MKQPKVLLLVTLFIIFLVAAIAQAVVSSTNATTEADCRWCHCQAVPARHHRIIPLPNCVECHPTAADASGTIATTLERDCTVCHGNVVGRRHHEVMAKRPELGCYTCHSISPDGSGTLLPGLNNTCGLTITPLTPNSPPVADAGGSQTIQAGQTAFLSGERSYDPDGTIVDYTWDFGDGAAGTGITTYHQFTKAGSYNVNLRVTDDKGATMSNTAVITVAPNPVVTANEVLWLKGMASETAADSASIAQNITLPFADSNNTQLFSISNTCSRDSAIAMRSSVDPANLTSAVVRLMVNATTCNRSQNILIYPYASDFDNIDKLKSVAKAISYTGSPIEVSIDISSLLPQLKVNGKIKVRVVTANQTITVTRGYFILK